MKGGFFVVMLTNCTTILSSAAEEPEMMSLCRLRVCDLSTINIIIVTTITHQQTVHSRKANLC